ncbi:MAG: SDR family NAD(P)-dependent oxidoreductase [Luteolibacter sp.]
MNTSHKLAGKTALVTGASKGIGASIAIHLAAEGAEVIVNYSSDQAGADLTVAEITAAGGKAIAVQANVAVAAEIEHLVEESVKAFGKVDILVNNAGVYQFAPLEESTPELFHRQFDINVLGLLLTTKAAVRHFPASGGAIINISSVASTLGMAGGAVYCGTKAAVDAITRSLAKELGPRGIRINSINPGMVVTEGTATAGIDGSDFQKSVIATTPLGRIGIPADIATAAVFLASDDSSWITGETLFISGGYR